LEEVREHRATVIQYIGELCRYLLALPPHPDDSKSGVRWAIGNGLRADIWEEFRTRFGIERIAEFYAATEGAGGLINTENKVGACGLMTPMLATVNPAKLARYDVEKDELVRNASGYCVECEPGEAGEFLAPIVELFGISNFKGYTDAASTNKKILRNVFVRGDVYFRSGDLLRLEKDGFVYFVDRIGDSFRWKGENVSTNEVGELISKFSDATREPNVYGVAIPGYDGRAGMVAFPSLLVGLDKELHAVPPLDLDGFAAYVIKTLPFYARPLFIRLLPEAMDVTGTFKHKKTQLVADGCDPAKISDPLYFLDQNTRKYLPLTPELYKRICSGTMKI